MKPPNIVPEHTAAAGADIVPHEYIARPDMDPETSEEAAAAGPTAAWTFWDTQIKASLNHEKLFRAEGEATERMYFGPQETVTTNGEDPNALPKIDEKTALIHANIDVLKPLIYSETPQIVVRRRFNGDFKTDATDLMATEAVSRLGNYILDTEDFDSAMIGARDDWLIPGRGIATAVYSERVKGDRLVQRVFPRHREWQRVLFAPEMAWEDMPWMAIEHSLTYTKIKGRFGEEVANKFSYNNTGLKDSTQAAEDDTRLQNPSGVVSQVNTTAATTISPFATTIVWEIWDKEREKVIWWSPFYTADVLDEVDDPLQLDCFFPCPRPLTATTKGRRLTPRPDVRYYERRADEVMRATEKMSELLDVIAVAGLIPASDANELKKLFEGKNQLIPVQAWLTLIQKGSINDIVQWLPLAPIVAALQALQLLRQQAKDAMFEASGVSDVMRAQGDPNATATQEQLKGKYAGMRLSERQRRMAIFAMEMIRILIDVATGTFETEFIAEICGLDLPMTEAERAQIIADQQAEIEKFQAMAAMHAEATAMAQEQQAMAAEAQQTGQQVQIDPLDPGPPPVPPELPPPPETSWELVHARIRSDLHRKITISIETSSTILADEAADKEQRVEFITAFAQFVGALLPMVQAGQMPMKTMKEMLLFGVRGFPKSRTLELQINQLPDELPTPEAVEEASITVAKIKGEIDKELQANDHAFQIQMKGVELVEKGLDKEGEPGPEHPEPPMPEGEDKKPAPKPRKKG